MAGIYPQWSFPQAVVLAIKAGDDMIVGASGIKEMAANYAALRNGTLTF